MFQFLNQRLLLGRRLSVAQAFFGSTNFKSHKGARKRMRLTTSGKIRRTQMGRQHNTGYRPRQAINKLGGWVFIKNKAEVRRFKRVLGKFK